MNIDFDKYKNCLKILLSKLGYNTNHSPMHCINPSHPDKNPSMVIYDAHFKCMSCEAHGDIYDAIGLIKGISNKTEQFKEVQSIMGDVWQQLPKKKNEKFIPDKRAEDKFREYVINQAKIKKEEVKHYFKIRNCPEEMINKLSEMVGYWPGIKIAEKEIDRKILFSAGIRFLDPSKKRSKNGYLWWYPGIVLKLGKGFKLFYFDENGESKKFGTKSCLTFPTPSLPDSDKINIVEGEIDALSMLYAGYENTIAIGGVNGLTDEKIKELFQYDKIYLIFDNDKAGRKKRESLKQRLIKNGYTGEIYIVRLPLKTDPDKLVKQGKKDKIEKALIDSEKKEKEIKKKKEEIEIKNQAEKKPPFYFVGYDEKHYYVFPKNQSISIQIGRADGAISSMMYDLADYEWWLYNFQKINEETGNITLNTRKAITWFRKKAQSKGIFKEENILGVGAHFEKNNIIVNTGDGLFLENQQKKINYEEYEGKKIFKRSTVIFDISGDQWKIEECQELFYELMNYGFSKFLDYILMMGFITLSPFSSILNRRPHLAIIGQKGCGKTTLIENIIRPAIGETGIYVEGKTSEAGIRQRIGKDCRPTIIDEFESHNKDEYQRNRNILGLARSAYGGEGEIIKGTTGQKPIIFKTKLMFLFSAINITFDNDADRSRIPILKMKRSDKKIGKTFNFQGLRKRTFNNLKKIIKNIKLTKKYLINQGYDARISDTYGTFVGGFWSSISDDDFLKSNERLNNLVKNAINDIHYDIDETISDEELLVNYILNYRMKEAHTSITIAEMLTEIQEGTGNLFYDKQLKQIGIRRDEKLKLEGKYHDCVAISTNNQFISEILKDSPYQNYKNILIRHPASIFDITKTVRLSAGLQTRCIILDWKKIEEMHFEKKDKDLPF